MADQVKRVRAICMAMPDVSEKLSHGEPAWFTAKRMFAMFSNNHHQDGHIAVWIPAAPGVQGMLVQNWPRKFYRPPYLGPSGWVGIELGEVGDDELAAHLSDGWKLIVEKGRAKSKRKPKATAAAARRKG